MKRSRFHSLLGMALVLSLPVSAAAAPVTFFGEDLGLGENTRLAAHANADAARANFLSNLVGVSVEDFEGFATGASNLSVNFGGGLTANLSGGTVQSVPSGTNGFGRYPISGNKFYETSQNFTLNFNQAIAAFGFYGVDIGDFSGQLSLHTVSGSTINMNVPHTLNSPGGSVLYFGFYTTNPAELFTGITFATTTGGDVFAFDDFTIGSLEQVAPVPEPATMALVGFGLAAAGARRLRRRR